MQTTYKRIRQEHCIKTNGLKMEFNAAEPYVAPDDQASQR